MSPLLYLTRLVLKTPHIQRRTFVSLHTASYVANALVFRPLFHVALQFSLNSYRSFPLLGRVFFCQEELLTFPVQPFGLHTQRCHQIRIPNYRHNNFTACRCLLSFISWNSEAQMFSFVLADFRPSVLLSYSPKFQSLLVRLL